MMPRTVLDAEEAQAILRDYGLKLHALSPLHRGTINSNYRADTDAGPLFLRVNEGKTDAEVRFEADLIWHLTSHGVATPAVWRTLRGQPFVSLPAGSGSPHKQLMLMGWAEGDELTEEQIGEREAHQVGATLAGLHRAAAGFRGRRTGIYTPAHVQARVKRLHHEPRVPDGIVEFLHREVQRHQSSRQDELPAGLGHNDLFPDNLLFTGGKRNREVAWVLDLEQAAWLPYAYDLAVALLSFCAPVPPETAAPDAPPDVPGRLGPLVLAPARALLAGYAAVRPLGPAERKGIYEQARFAALRFTVTRLTDVHLERSAAPAGPHSKDYRDFLRRLEALAAVGATAFGAALGL